MEFSQETLEYLAHLARLDLKNSVDAHSIPADLRRIVQMVDEISAANTEGVAPIAHSIETAQRLREDTITEINERDVLLALAPKHVAGLFLVPKVIE